jgi:hypothetical protein
MVQTAEDKWWIKIRLKSVKDISELQKKYEVEIFRQTIRKVDSKNLLVEGYVPKRMCEELKSKFSVRILGDVGKMVKEASEYVSKINRYKKP